jgi:hypothetical protein
LERGGSGGDDEGTYKNEGVRVRMPGVVGAYVCAQLKSTGSDKEGRKGERTEIPAM